MAHSPSPEQRIDAPVLTALSGSTPGRGESRLRMTLRHSLPVMGVVVVVVLVAVIAYYVYDSNRRGAVALSNDLVTAIDRRVAVETHAYLAPAEQFLELADAAAAGRGVFEGGPEVERFALHALHRLGSFLKPLSAKNICSPAVKTNSAEHSAHFRTLSWYSIRCSGAVLGKESQRNIPCLPFWEVS